MSEDAAAVVVWNRIEDANGGLFGYRAAAPGGWFYRVAPITIATAHPSTGGLGPAIYVPDINAWAAAIGKAVAANSGKAVTAAELQALAALSNVLTTNTKALAAAEAAVPQPKDQS